jgi:hypothetical protein
MFYNVTCKCGFCNNMGVRDPKAVVTCPKCGKAKVIKKEKPVVRVNREKKTRKNNLRD